MSQIIFEDLYAYRMQYLDYTTNEYIIINKLKIKLINYGIEANDINNILYNFYLSYDIPITFNEIEEVPLYIQYSFNLLYTNIPNNIQPNDNSNNNSNDSSNEPNDSNEPNNNSNDNSNDNSNEYNNPLDVSDLVYLNQFINILGSIINMLPENNNEMNDVIVTTDEKSIDEFDILKITDEMDEKCTICLEKMEINDEYYNINCKHIYHKECLRTYLLNYNHICPICRNEIGKTNVNL